MLPKVHLTSDSRISGSRWVITPLWLSESLRSYLYSSSVYSCHLFLISSASIRSLLFLFFIMPIFAWNILLVSLIFLKRSIVFPVLLFSSVSFIFFNLSLLFFGTLHSDGDIFPFLLCLHFSSFVSYLWGLLRQPFCLSAFLLSGDASDHCLRYNVMNLHL